MCVLFFVLTSKRQDCSTAPKNCSCSVLALSGCDAYTLPPTIAPTIINTSTTMTNVTSTTTGVLLLTTVAPTDYSALIGGAVGGIALLLLAVALGLLLACRRQLPLDTVAAQENNYGRLPDRRKPAVDGGEYDDTDGVRPTAAGEYEAASSALKL